MTPPADEQLLTCGAPVVLRDGSTVHVRPAVRTDGDALECFLRELSDQSKVFRFFHAV